jgi:hypothetical protein
MVSRLTVLIATMFLLYCCGFVFISFSNGYSKLKTRVVLCPTAAHQRLIFTIENNTGLSLGNQTVPNFLQSSSKILFEEVQIWNTSITSDLERSGSEGVETACRLLPNFEVSTCLSRARETGTNLKYEMEKIFQAASERVNRSMSTWPGFDYSVANTTRVLAFTVCTPGDSSGRAPQEQLGRPTSFDEIKSLCIAQREGMEIWGKRNKITFLQIVDPEILDPDRAPHWQKVAYMHAFLQLDFDIVFFLDADCMVAQVDWDIRAFADQVLPPATKKLWAFVDDDVDYHATGDFLMRKHTTSLSFLQDWYRLSAPFFNTTAPYSVLRSEQPGISTNPLAFVQRETDEKGLSLRRRCHAHFVYHEQGCLGQFYNAAPYYLENLVLIDWTKFHKLFIDRGSTPIFHACCRPREEQERYLRECSAKMNAHGSC